MAQNYRSEIRDSTIRDLLLKVKVSNFGSYLRRMKMTKIRAFEGETVDFEFPVTALIAANGGGKSTMLGAAALAYKNTRPAIFFPKSSLGDDSMANWGVSFELIDKSKNATQLISKSARFKNKKWARDEVVERSVIYFGITRTVPAGERTEFKKIATPSYRHLGKRLAISTKIIEHVAKILGKDVSLFEVANLASGKEFYIGGDGRVTYLSIYQFSRHSQSFGSGRHSRRSLIARRRPRVNQESFPRASLAG